MAGNVPGGYFIFKNAYLGGAVSAKVFGGKYETTPDGCILAGLWGQPWPYLWLYADGHIEYGILPPVLTLLPKDEQERLAQMGKAGRFYTQDGGFVPTAAGFIYWTGYSGSIRDRLYLFKDDRYIKIYRGEHIDINSFVVSPDGCRLAFEEHGWRMDSRESSPLKVIDLCLPGQTNSSSNTH